MAFLTTGDMGEYSPTLTIKGGVNSCQQYLIPDSGIVDKIFTSDIPWSYVNSMERQNSRINGRYNIYSHFSQGYFNFANWSGNIVYSADGNKSGVNRVYGSTALNWNAASLPYLTNFWDRSPNQVGGRTSPIAERALYHYGYSHNGKNSNIRPKNISVAYVMSGYYNDSEQELGLFGVDNNQQQLTFLYTGDYIPTSGITVYGRVGSTNPNYELTDDVLSFGTPNIIADPATLNVLSYPSGWTFSNVGSTMNDGTGTGEWVPGDLDSLLINNKDCRVQVNPMTHRPDLSPSGHGITSQLISKWHGYPDNGIYNIPSGSIIKGIEVIYSRLANKSGVYDFTIKLCKNGVATGGNKSTGEMWPVSSIYFAPSVTAPSGLSYGSATFGSPTDLWETTWEWDDFNTSFGTSCAIIAYSGDPNYNYSAAFAAVENVSANVYYLGILDGPVLVKRISLQNKFNKENRAFNWNVTGFDSNLDVPLPFHRITCDRFSNFLFTHNPETGSAELYAGYDNEQLILQDIRNLGNVDVVFDYNSIVLYDSTSNSSGNFNNAKIWTDLGVDGQYWSQGMVREFDNHRLNPGFYLNNSLDIPASSDSTNYLNFHFPTGCSGTIGSCNSGNPYDLGYFVPFASSVGDLFYEFDRSQFNPTALTLQGWIENVGTNPSGFFNAKINFCNRSNELGKQASSIQYFWSGYPIEVSDGDAQFFTMSGVMYDGSGNASDLQNVSKDQANNAEMLCGVWYQSIGREYNGDIKLYSARTYIDGWCVAPKASGYIPLYTYGMTRISDSLDLYIHQSFTVGDIPLYTIGYGLENSGFPLFTAGGFAQDGCTLYLASKDSAFSGFPLYVDGGTAKGSMPLYIFSQPPSELTGQIPLSMWATLNSGVANSMSLFIGENAPSGVRGDGMNIFLGGNSTSRLSASMPIFLRRDSYGHGDSTTLFCYNGYTEASGTLTMFTKGPQYASTYGSMNLFIGKDSGVITDGEQITDLGAGGYPFSLYYFPLPITLSDMMTMFISGPQSSSSGVPLYTAGGPDLYSSIPLYAHGIGTDSENLNLYVNGY